MKDTLFKMFENKLIQVAAVIMALSTVSTAIIWSVRHHLVIKPELDRAIQSTKDYSDLKLSDHEKIEHAFIHSENLETQNRVLSEILRLEELHHKTEKQSKRSVIKNDYFEEEYNDVKSADRDALEINQMVEDRGERP